MSRRIRIETAVGLALTTLVVACSRSKAPTEVDSASAADRDTGAAEGAAGGASREGEVAHDAGSDAAQDPGGARDAAAPTARTDAGASPQDAAPDARQADAAVLDCSFSGEPRIEPADSEFSTPQRFSLEGISALPARCVRYAISPDSYPRYGSSEREPIAFDSVTGELAVSRLRNNTVFEITASVAGEPVASTTAHYFDPSDPLHGLYSEVAVLRCPDHEEEPRDEVGELKLSDGLTVTFHPFETYTDYEGQYTWTPDPQDPRRGELELMVDSGSPPDTLDPSGTFYARPDGKLELRDLWLGPDDAQCGHVFERVW